MTRRDTIIIAALTNAGLLVVLFVSALGMEKGSRQDRDSFEMQPALHLKGEEALAKEPLPERSQKISLEREVVEIEVQKGDRIDTIAGEHGMELEEIFQLNGAETRQLIVGQKLKVYASGALQAEKEPSKESPVAKSEEKKEAAKSGEKANASKASGSKNRKSPEPVLESEYHYVQRGESPWVIAKKYGISVEKLLKLNDLNETSSRRLREGDRLRVR